jgi:hypothetical protein
LVLIGGDVGSGWPRAIKSLGVCESEFCCDELGIEIEQARQNRRSDDNMWILGVRETERVLIERAYSSRVSYLDYLHPSDLTFHSSL